MISVLTAGHRPSYQHKLKCATCFPCNFETEVFYKKTVLNNSTMLIQKHLNWGLFLTKLQHLGTATLLKRDRSFLCEYCEIFKQLAAFVYLFFSSYYYFPNSYRIFTSCSAFVIAQYLLIITFKKVFSYIKYSSVCMYWEYWK